MAKTKEEAFGFKSITSYIHYAIRYQVIWIMQRIKKSKVKKDITPVVSMFLTLMGYTHNLAVRIQGSKERSIILVGK